MTKNDLESYKQAVIKIIKFRQTLGATIRELHRQQRITLEFEPVSADLYSFNDEYNYVEVIVYSLSTDRGLPFRSQVVRVLLSELVTF